MTKKQRDGRGRNHKNNQEQKKSKPQNNKGSKIKYVTLPYDFIPFAEEWHFPYKREVSRIDQEGKGTLPKHNTIDGLSGTITYQITPKSDLAVEVRKKLDGTHFVSGSVVRGKIRSNVEILSASYPEFIDRSPIFFRDIASKDSSYRNRIQSLNSNEENPNGGKKSKDNLSGIEHSIEVGFLRKVGNDFYVTPAKKIGDKNFLSIKEHRLMAMKLGSASGDFTPIYDWGKQLHELSEFKDLQMHIDRLTEEIKSERKRVDSKLKNIQENFSRTFTEEFPFNSTLRNIRKKGGGFDFYLEEEKRKLLRWLKQLSPCDTELHRLYELYVERWGLKAKLDQKYVELGKKSRRSNQKGRKPIRKNFSPYQKSVYFKSGPNGGIEWIQFEPSKDVTQKGYLFNSTNASSKRSHYFVMEPDRDQQNDFVVPQSVINGYNKAMKKFRVPVRDEKFQKKCKAFYDIFDGYEKLCKNGKHPEGLIVFFHTAGRDEIKHIGRTPYFKIAHKHGIGDIIGKKESNKVDYANALFGFTPDEHDEEGDAKVAYKSRLRFSPVDINGDVDLNSVVNDLVLLTPSASASAMYLKQDGGKLNTYESEKMPELNGYKYYHVLEEKIDAKKKEAGDKFVSCRRVLKGGNISFTGKIHFRNLTDEELGLLLLSLDWKELQKSSKYGHFIADFKGDMEKAYELIGGAKPYGYGKVKVEIQDLEVEKTGTDFETLVLGPTENVDDTVKFIDAFIDSMGDH